MQAATTGFPVLVPDLRHSTQVARWPIFAAAVAEQTRVRALFALPMQFGVINLGVLDLYRATPGGLGQEQWRDGLAVANIAAVMMLELCTDPDNPDGYDDSDAPWLDPALGSRAEIHQATGRVLVQLGITATEALARLRAHAFTEQRLLLEVAADVVARRLEFTHDMTGQGSALPGRWGKAATSRSPGYATTPARTTSPSSKWHASSPRPPYPLPRCSPHTPNPAPPPNDDKPKTKNEADLDAAIA